MENFKFTLVSFVMVLVVAGIGFLAYMALEKGDENGMRQQVRELKEQVADRDEQIVERDRQIAELETDLESAELLASQTPTEEETSKEPVKNPPATTGTGLLAELESLKAKGVVLEPGDSGAAVGTIQKFLNVYNKTSGGVDNDFGPGTRKKVEAFQVKEKMTPDGGVGPTTLSKMISWLKAHS